MITSYAHVKRLPLNGNLVLYKGRNCLVLVTRFDKHVTVVLQMKIDILHEFDFGNILLQAAQSLWQWRNLWKCHVWYFLHVKRTHFSLDFSKLKRIVKFNRENIFLQLPFIYRYIFHILLFSSWCLYFWNFFTCHACKHKFLYTQNVTIKTKSYVHYVM